MIHAEEMTFNIGTFELRRFSIDIAEGEYFILLGPPGSGKTIFLECLCGLKKNQSGRILIDGRDVTKLEPRKRGIGYVPQDYALFPHLTVEQNITFGLRAHGYENTNITETFWTSRSVLWTRSPGSRFVRNCRAFSAGSA